jgi:peptidoglycan/xylan/chitin deacetylase (PgdA/CDA1 family)
MGIFHICRTLNRKSNQLIKNTKINIAVEITSTTWNHPKLSKPKKGHLRQQWNLRAIMPRLLKKYVGQRGRTFRIRYKEYTRTITTDRNRSMYARHILGYNNTHGTIENIMRVTHLTTKGRPMNTLGNVYVYKISKQGVQLNAVHADYASHI